MEGIIAFFGLKSFVHTFSKNAEYINRYYNIEQSYLLLKQKRNKEKDNKFLNLKRNKKN